MFFNSLLKSSNSLACELITEDKVLIRRNEFTIVLDIMDLIISMITIMKGEYGERTLRCDVFSCLRVEHV